MFLTFYSHHLFILIANEMHLDFDFGLVIEHEFVLSVSMYSYDMIYLFKRLKVTSFVSLAMKYVAS